MIFKPEIKKVLCLILCLVLAFPIALSAEADTDYEGNWAEESIKALFEKGFVNGYGDGSFKPEEQISRAEFMAIINRAFDCNEKASISFSDVEEGKWYYEHIARAVKANYITGYTDGTMRPGSNITRQEAAVILARILGLEKNADIKVLASVKDGDKIQGWSSKGIAAMISNGYISLDNAGNFFAAKPLARAEMAVAVMKSYVKHIKKVYVLPGVFTGGSIDGSVTIDNKDITLKDTVINGDLFLGEGIGEGNVHLINVTVKGDTIVRGGGENSITIEDCQFSKIIIIKENNKIRILAKGNSTVNEIDVQSGAVLESEDLTGEGFGYVTIAEGLDDDALVELIGNFESVEIRADGIQIQASGGTIANMDITGTASNVDITLASDSVVTTFTADTATTVTGTGRIESAKVSVSGTTIGVPVKTVDKPADVTVGTGTNTPAAGTSTPTSPSGGGGGGGSDDNDNDNENNNPSTVAISAVNITGSPVVGSVLTAAPTPASATVSYQWKSSDTADGTYSNITGATSSTYTLVSDNAGKYIKVTAAGTGSYTGTAASIATAAVVGIEATPIGYEPAGGLLGKSNTVRLFGTTFIGNDGDEVTDNWVIDTGTTNLQVSRVTKTGSQNVTIDYTLKTAGQGTGSGTVTIRAKAAATAANINTNTTSVVLAGPTISTTSTIANGSVNPVVIITLENDTFTADGISNLPSNWTGSVGTTGLTGGIVTRDSDTQITFQLNGTAAAGTITLHANAAALASGIPSNTITITVPEASGNPIIINEISSADVDMRRGSIIMGYTFSGDAGIITYGQAISDTYALDLANSTVTLAKFDGASYTQIGNTVNLSALTIENSTVSGESAKVTFADFGTLLVAFGLDFSNPANIPTHERVIVKSKTSIDGNAVANPWGPIDSGWVAIDSELLNPISISAENSTATIEPGNKPAGFEFPVSIHIKDENNANLPDGEYAVEILNGATPIGGGAQTVFTGGQASVDVILADEGTYTLFVKVNNTVVESIANVTAVSSPSLDEITTTMDGTQIHLTFSKAMADPAGKEDQFTVTVNSVENPIVAAALKPGDSKTIMLTLTNSLHGGEAITIAYTQGNVAAADGGLLRTFIPRGTEILVTNISVSGEASVTSVVYGETLQMIAAVLPADATNPSVVWSVVNGTGSATISGTGLLTATGAGTVTVKATANDSSGVVGERIITIESASDIPITLTGIAADENKIIIALFKTVGEDNSYISGLSIDDFTLVKDFGTSEQQLISGISLYRDEALFSPFEYEIHPGTAFATGSYRLAFYKAGYEVEHIDVVIE